MPKLPHVARDEEGNELVLIGWYCWRCRDINSRACRSDNVPMYVPADWQKDMDKELGRKEAEDFERTEKPLKCSGVYQRIHHRPHTWEPQPGMDLVRCEGYDDPE